ncbi:MAG: hypothetical protein Q8L22_09250 [Reyranella sp.]|nr:hypothetical protein [Reyranella sp.]
MTSTIPITEDDKKALTSLVYRYHLTSFRRADDRELIKELEKQVANRTADLVRIASALTIFGIDISKKGDSQTNFWRDVEKTVGTQEYYEALNRARAEMGRSPYDPRTRFGGGEELVETPNSEAETPTSEGTVRDLVLSSLASAGSEGRKASAIRIEIEAQRGTKLHEKTVGMTLYRLSQETPPRVHRRGRTWFHVEPGTALTGANDEQNTREGPKIKGGH